MLTAIAEDAPVGGGGRLVGLDAVRALAAAAVLVGHSILTFAADQGHPLGSRILNLAIIAGQAAVTAFFLVSGEAVTRSLLSDRHLGRYAVRRAARILPLYWLAGAFALLVDLTTSFPVSGRAVVGYLTFTSLYVNEHALLGVNWTLCLEVVFYLTAPALLCLHRRSPAAWRVLVIAIATVAVLPVPLRESGHAWAVGHVGAVGLLVARSSGPFLLGMGWALGECHLPRHPRLPVLGLLLVTLLASFRLFYDCPELWYLLASLVLSLAVQRVSHSRSSVLGPLSRVGAVSYGIYMLHQPLLDLLARTVRPLDHRQDILTAAALALPALLVACGLAQASWVLLERPVMRRARRASPGTKPPHISG